MKKILLVFGTRPEAIKMAPLVHALKADACFDAKVCVTVQHREMLDQLLGLFDIVVGLRFRFKKIKLVAPWFHKKVSWRGLDNIGTFMHTDKFSVFSRDSNV